MNLRYLYLINKARVTWALKDLNPKAHHKCWYCDKEFRGVWSYHRLRRHKVTKHPLEALIELTAIVMTTVLLLGIILRIDKEGGEHSEHDTDK